MLFEEWLIKKLLILIVIVAFKIIFMFLWNFLPLGKSFFLLWSKQISQMPTLFLLIFVGWIHFSILYLIEENILSLSLIFSFIIKKRNIQKKGAKISLQVKGTFKKELELVLPSYSKFKNDFNRKVIKLFEEKWSILDPMINDSKKNFLN